ncbi:MAG: GPW/gp25 family protein [Comamonas sp.]|jgi:phage baseplate assembly protein W|uniref:GPW/gp25 family protein n=1 Tax=Comamonas sp. TaxID=34028 RepID=UPI00282AD11A|nr:GPW/gp25 family protein [Comamonas sp.]MDR0216424.1 GPW/gp25 family protein [Comamonas sp.]
MMNANTGQLLGYSAHISQSIADILTTPIGSRLMRRGYGSFIPQLIDQPMTPANILRLQAATAQAIMKHEPRTRLRRASLAFDASGRAVLQIERQDRGQASTRRQTVTIQPAPGANA